MEIAGGGQVVGCETVCQLFPPIVSALVGINVWFLKKTKVKGKEGFN